MGKLLKITWECRRCEKHGESVRDTETGEIVEDYDDVDEKTLYPVEILCRECRGTMVDDFVQLVSDEMNNCLQE